jgi:hypothetical protein
MKSKCYLTWVFYQQMDCCWSWLSVSVWGFIKRDFYVSLYKIILKLVKRDEAKLSEKNAKAETSKKNVKAEMTSPVQLVNDSTTVLLNLGYLELKCL